MDDWIEGPDESHVWGEERLAEVKRLIGELEFERACLEAVKPLRDDPDDDAA